MEPGTHPPDESDTPLLCGFAQAATCSAQTFSESLSARSTGLYIRFRRLRATILGHNDLVFSEGEAPIPEDIGNRSINLQIWRFSVLRPQRLPVSENGVFICRPCRSRVSLYRKRMLRCRLICCHFVILPSLSSRRTYHNSLSLHKSRLIAQVRIFRTPLC